MHSRYRAPISAAANAAVVNPQAYNCNFRHGMMEAGSSALCATGFANAVVWKTLT
jgi:hypothetical protein